MTDPDLDWVALVLDPVDTEDFFARHRERTPLHVARDDPARFDRLIDLPMLERMLGTRPLHFPTVQLSRAADPVAPSEYIDEDDRIVVSRVLDYHRQGATLVVSQAQQQIDTLAALCRGMQSCWQMRCQTNVYLSRSASRGFNPHYDAHDVFILQVAGTKVFRFYEGGPALPLVRH